jgi:ABC-type multidrug transport system fused ATPase/permease subunit
VRFDNLGLRYPGPASGHCTRSTSSWPQVKRWVCGRTGAGKSSLLGVLRGHVSCLPGEIFYGNQPLSRLAPEAVRDLYDTVSQIPLTFFGTLRANLAP